MSIIDEYEQADDKPEKYKELNRRYPHCVREITFLCSCDTTGKQQTTPSQFGIKSCKYLREFVEQNPPSFAISNKCCDICKKKVAHDLEKTHDMTITGERCAEGGIRASAHFANGSGCFGEKTNGSFRLRPLYYVRDADKAWYKQYYGIKYSDAYEVYGLTRTGCCGCAISAKAVEDLERIRPYEPNLVKAAWNVFGDSYRYRQKYNEYKTKRKEEGR